MTRDLSERITLFIDGEASNEPDIQRIALNMDQITRLKPPPNPAKVTDSRFADYARKFGHESWELDALNPQALVALASDAIMMCVDSDAWSARESEIENIRTKLHLSAERFKA